MSPTLKNILAIVAGVILGGLVNSSLINIGSNFIAPPDGVDPMDLESIKTNADLYTAKHFVVPLIAHAFGTLLGSFVAVRFSADRALSQAMVVGVFFMIGGLVMAFMLPDFWIASIVDLLLAYFPMAWLGHRLGTK